MSDSKPDPDKRGDRMNCVRNMLIALLLAVDIVLAFGAFVACLDRGIALPVVYFAPHPDDEIGASWAIHSQQGENTYLVVVTDSTWQGFDRPPLPDYQVRRNETICAAEKIGFDHVIFLGIDELDLDDMPMGELQSLLSPYVVTLRPKKVYLPSEFDAQFHPDHQKVRDAVLGLLLPTTQAWEWTMHEICSTPYGDYTTTAEICEFKVDLFSCYTTQWWPMMNVDYIEVLLRGEAVHAR
jgi:LmbE family N-acetylglucosaminyl deacetylase